MPKKTDPETTPTSEAFHSERDAIMAERAEPYDPNNRPPLPPGMLSSVDPLASSVDVRDAIENFGQVITEQEPSTTPPMDPAASAPEIHRAEDVVDWTHTLTAGDRLVREGVTDAMQWAEAFVSIIADLRLTDSVMDPGYMVGWFANAIEVAKSAERAKIARGIRGIGLGDAGDEAADTRDAIASMVKSGRI